jgi:hypothetical protein
MGDDKKRKKKKRKEKQGESGEKVSTAGWGARVSKESSGDVGDPLQGRSTVRGSGGAALCA